VPLNSLLTSECDCTSVVGDEGAVANGQPLLRRRRDASQAETEGVSRPRRPEGTSVNALQRLADVEDGYQRFEAPLEDAGLKEHLARRRKQLTLQLFRRVGLGLRRPAWQAQWVPPALARQQAAGGALVGLPLTGADGWGRAASSSSSRCVGGSSSSSCSGSSVTTSRRFARADLALQWFEPEGGSGIAGSGAGSADVEAVAGHGRAPLSGSVPQASASRHSDGAQVPSPCGAAGPATPDAEPGEHPRAECADTELDSTAQTELLEETEPDSSARAEVLADSQASVDCRAGGRPEDPGVARREKRKRHLLSPLAGERLLKRKRQGLPGEDEEPQTQDPVRRNRLQGLPSPELLQLAEQIERRFL